ncbi:MAG: hypothetical protein M1837_000862 [Sclerophora amabilis]|nr:MAG: hypothetical protein M1837_000862 [Sclerophora amabilis]
MAPSPATPPIHSTTSHQPQPPPPPPPPRSPQPSPAQLGQHRLSLPFPLRLTLCTSIATLTGLSLGVSHGAQTAALRFRAEHAHKLPKTATGWYLYHKSKNYNVMFGGVREALKMGAKVSVYVAGFFTIEEAVDRARGTKDFGSTVVGGLGVAGAFSAWNRFPLAVAARTAKLGLLVGLGFGLVQDTIGLARGRRPAYMNLLLLQSPNDSTSAA